MANKPKRKVSNIMLVVICVMIICYAIANFVLQYFTQIEVSPTLTTAWFSFWGVELVSLAAIKTSKIKHGYDNENVIVEDDMEAMEE
jgi:biotin transporter BioY